MSDSSQAIKRRGFMFVLSSPSGAGKTTLSRLLLEKDDNLVMSVSATTREKRPNEVEGEDYFFVNQNRFDEMVENNELLEHAKVFYHSYGTPKQRVNESLDAGIDVLFDIDWQGQQQLEKNCRDDLVSIFILPPSMKELGNRLKKRAQDSDDVIENRMKKASGEIEHWEAYDYVIINRDINDSLKKVYSILRAERQKRIRQQDLNNFVGNLLREDI